MGKGIKVVTQEGMGSDTGIFYIRGYGEGYYSTLPIGYPLPSLDFSLNNIIIDYWLWRKSKL